MQGNEPNQDVAWSAIENRVAEKCTNVLPNIEFLFECLPFMNKRLIEKASAIYSKDLHNVRSQIF
jgi:hypothetical protein